MAFSAITSTQCDVGQPVTSTLMNKIRTNFNDHETRILATETGLVIKTPITFEILGSLGLAGTSLSTTDLLTHRTPYNITVTNIKLTTLSATSGAITETVQIGYYRGSNPWTSILSAAISIPPSTAIRTTFTGSVSTSALLANDIITVRVTAVAPTLLGFTLNLEHQNT